MKRMLLILGVIMVLLSACQAGIDPGPIPVEPDGGIGDGAGPLPE